MFLALLAPIMNSCVLRRVFAALLGCCCAFMLTYYRFMRPQMSVNQTVQQTLRTNPLFILCSVCASVCASLCLGLRVPLLPFLCVRFLFLFAVNST
uniref:Putative secreted peptide n=1 Tax=Anopheles braziliensis TaxID=58242 RepID=A0A2M3ZSP6_9DIPT